MEFQFTASDQQKQVVEDNGRNWRLTLNDEEKENERNRRREMCSNLDDFQQQRAPEALGLGRIEGNRWKQELAADHYIEDGPQIIVPKARSMGM